jgi:hypothetical protein
MKAFNFIKQTAAALVIAAIAFTGCDLDNGNDYEPEFTIDPDMYPIVAYADETAVVAEAYSFPRTWKAEIPKEAATWLSITPESGEAGKNPCTFHFKPNTTKETRSTTVVFTFDDGATAEVYVVQVGANKPL